MQYFIKAGLIGVDSRPIWHFTMALSADVDRVTNFHTRPPGRSELYIESVADGSQNIPGDYIWDIAYWKVARSV